MLQRIREGLTLVLIAVLPFHAFLVTVGTKLIAGSGQSPLPVLALWKEAVLGMILLVALVEIFREWKTESGKWKVDVFDILIVGLIAWSIILYFVFHFPLSTFHFAFGFKYDFLPLVAFLILRRVPWSPWFISTAVAVLLSVGAVVAVYGIAAIFLPMSWFTALGYSDLHSLYVPGGPLAPFQQIESIGIRRMQSVMSGPNQMGLWLLIPWSIAFVDLVRRRSFAGLLVCSLLVVGILLSFSRSAWIAAAVIGAVVAWKHLSRKQMVMAASFLIVLAVIAVAAFPSIVLRATSTTGHIDRPLQALQIMKEHPLGLGLGSAGPASNRFSDACVDLPAGSDASWAQAHSQLCVFVGGNQVQPPLPSGELRPAGQPADRTCSCPLLPENWYLQIGVELGWIGFILYVTLVLMLLKRLTELKIENVKLKKEEFSIFNFQFSIGLAFLGISIAALFLHAWEDSAVAYTVWILMAMGLLLRRRIH
ncbi:hypothetical protein A2881_02140 [Candidatus Peribacteria bacterium RIFCSPHIGHO2_01_FULL_55_13]|nr:MAG: hypothetical protein A2881_02140 [Candidatus Peribacteria bacterium RIFCSPHIGHO2_01_FULL_55_13]OGJ64369.1 MAG: hypothetical protein A3F36_01100 [Candidatus Peribacteria bacterium RIFCSPHIGHO2_12_FULL_55_11]